MCFHFFCRFWLVIVIVGLSCFCLLIFLPVLFTWYKYYPSFIYVCVCVPDINCGFVLDLDSMVWVEILELSNCGFVLFSCCSASVLFNFGVKIACWYPIVCIYWWAHYFFWLFCHLLVLFFLPVVDWCPWWTFLLWYCLSYTPYSHAESRQQSDKEQTKTWSTNGDDGI